MIRLKECNHGKDQKEHCVVCEKLFELEDRRNKKLNKLESAVREIRELILQMPGDVSPDNSIAHIFLICERALENL
jgi:hypothetical protein